MKKTKFYYVLAILLSIATTSCDVSYIQDAEEIGVNLNLDAQLPIGYIEYTLSDLLEEADIQDLEKDNTGNYFFTYTKENLTGTDESGFNVQIEDKTIESSISTPITDEQFEAVGGSPYTITAQVPDINNPPTFMSPNPLIMDLDTVTQKITVLELSQEITEAYFDGGTMKIDFESTFDSDIVLAIDIPSFKKKSDDSVFEDSVTLQGVDSKSILISLSDYDADFTHDGENFDKTTNQIVINLKATFKFREGDELRDTDKVEYTSNLVSPSANVIFGDFKQEPFSVDSGQKIVFDFFDEFKDGDISFTDAEMIISATNGYGFPIGVDISNVKSLNTENNTSVNLSYTGSALNNTLIIDGITDYSPTATAVATEITLDKDNSNINELLSSKPSSIQLNFSGLANPINTPPNKNFYATVNEGIDVDFRIHVPLKVKFENILIEESIAFDDASDLEDLNATGLTLTIENSIRLSGQTELEFLDENDIVLTTVKAITDDGDNTNDFFTPANIDPATGEVTSSTKTTLIVELSKAEIDKIIDAKNINVKFTLNTPNSSDPNSISVQLNANSKLTATIGVKTNISINDEEN